MTPHIREISVPDLALRLGDKYAVYLVRQEEIGDVALELDAELEGAGTATMTAISQSAAQLLSELAVREGTLVVDVSAYRAADWRVLDRRRSALLRSGAIVLITTPDSFDELMRVAPNLASWIGADVYAHPSTAARRQLDEDSREQRLVSLRAWSGLSDDDVIRRAEEKSLPLDPEYAEWLVLLGQGTRLL